MPGFNGGILRNAYPLSEAQIKDVEKDVILNNKCIAYLDENNQICFAESFDPVIVVKNFAWNQVHQMFEQDGVFFKNIYEKTGLDTFTLIETLHKTDIDGPWEGGSTDTPAAGLYRESVLIKSWDELLTEGVVHVDNGNMYTNMDLNTWKNSSAEILVGELVLPNDGSVTTLSDGAFATCTHLTNVTIPNGVTSIGGGAFHYCSSLTSVTIPNGVTRIGHEAFYNCTGLTSITIPEGVTSIGNNAFEYCSSLTSVTIGNSVTSMGEYVFSECPNLTSVEMPDSLTSISNHTFYNCSSLTNVTIPNNVTSIGYAAFSHCYSLTSITIPDSVTSIGDHAFRECRGLTSITIPDSVTSIGTSAFYWCDGLTSVTIPDSVTSIGDWAFDDCSSLTNFVFTGTTVQWNAITLGQDWHYKAATYVQCSDGQVTL